MTFGKRAFDLILACLLAPFVGFIVLGLIPCLWIAQGRPIFHVSERMQTPQLGFQLWKFRSMIVASSDMGVSGGPKLARVTPMGAWMRAARLDELPQLWNVLRGELSFVGPRAPLRMYVQRFPQLYGEVLTSRPGITGLATLRFHRREQTLLGGCLTAADVDAVYCRSCVPQKARLDLLYQQRRSLWLDVWVIWQTVETVFWPARSRIGRKTWRAAFNAPLKRWRLNWGPPSAQMRMR